MRSCTFMHGDPGFCSRPTTDCLYDVGKSTSIIPGDELDTSLTLHLTQVALGSDAAAGDHTVYIETEGALGLLDFMPMIFPTKKCSS